MSGKKKNNTKKRSAVVKEKDIIKESDFEDYNSDNKKILVVALILAILIGGFAYIRSLDNKPVEEKPNVEEPNNQEEVLPPVVEDKNDNNDNYDNWNNYQPITTPTEKEEEKEEPVVVDIWEDLNNMPTNLEAGSEYELPEVIVDDNGEEIKAVVTYKFKSNEEDSEYTTVTEFDKTIMGTYLITYTINYTDGKVETKEVEIAVVDTVEPIINGISNESYLNEDVVLDITEYSPYIVELNGEVYDETYRALKDRRIEAIIDKRPEKIGYTANIR